MKTIRRVVIAILFLIVIFLTNNIYAKYNYIISMDAFSLNRDTSDILYSIEKNNNTNNYINEDIILKIIFNKKIQPVEGFELDEDSKVLIRTVTENEEKRFIVKDLSGNKKEINYNITNIDKEPPTISGIEDGVTYTGTKNIVYDDNIGIESIYVERYHDKLAINCEEHFYDTSFYKGLDVLGNQIYVDVTNRPKGTKYYKFYLNNQLKSTSNKSEYTYTDLLKTTTYTITVEAISADNIVLDKISKTVKTKSFTGISSKKEGDNFYVKITGIDERFSVGYCCLWNQDSNTQKYSYPSMNSDRSIDLCFNAYDINGVKSSGYYYFHLQLFNPSDSSLNEIAVMNVIFDDKIYVKYDDDNLNPEKLFLSGNYEIIVTDLAGNITKRNFTIN